MAKHLKFAAGLALAAALALCVPTWALAMGGMMGGGGSGGGGGLIGAVGNMMGFNKQNPAANLPQVPPGAGISNLGPGYQGYGAQGPFNMGTGYPGGAAPAPGSYAPANPAAGQMQGYR